MSKIGEAELIDMFYTLHEEYLNEDMTKEELKTLLRSPFVYLKHQMSIDGELKNLRLTHLGIFNVTPFRVRSLLEKEREKYLKGHYKTEKEFKKNEALLMDYLVRYDLKSPWRHDKSLSEEDME